jgi:hypothetical protein
VYVASIASAGIKRALRVDLVMFSFLSSKETVHGVQFFPRRGRLTEWQMSQLFAAKLTLQLANPRLDV